MNQIYPMKTKIEQIEMELRELLATENDAPRQIAQMFAELPRMDEQETIALPDQIQDMKDDRARVESELKELETTLEEIAQLVN